MFANIISNWNTTMVTSCFYLLIKNHLIHVCVPFIDLLMDIFREGNT